MSYDWEQLFPSTTPSGDRTPKMFYDPTLSAPVLIGYVNFTATTDKWVWDGTDWTHSLNSNAPIDGTFSYIDNGAQGAFYRSADTCVLFGGWYLLTSPTSNNHTWLWADPTWSKASPVHKPSARNSVCIDLDQGNDLIVLFGGQLDSGTYLADTWTWDGSDWTSLSPAHSPGARGAAPMTWDGDNGVLLLVGGATFPAMTDETWTWDGTDWTDMAPSTSPSEHVRQLAWRGPGLQTLAVSSDGVSTTHTWTWDGSDWTQESPVHAPAANKVTSVPQQMVWDETNGYIIGLFDDQTWIYRPDPAPLTAAIRHTFGMG